MVAGSNPVTVTSGLDNVPVSSKEFLHIQGNIECRFSLKSTVHISTDNTAHSFGQFS